MEQIRPNHPGAVQPKSRKVRTPRLAFKKSSEKFVMEQYFFTLGGKICCVRCNATSKRTNLQCKAPAIKGKTKCRTHGGKSTGPKTDAGKARCAAAKTIHGRETRQGRIERGEAMTRLRELEDLGRLLGIISGPRTPGRKPGGCPNFCVNGVKGH